METKIRLPLPKEEMFVIEELINKWSKSNIIKVKKKKWKVSEFIYCTIEEFQDFKNLNEWEIKEIHLFKLWLSDR